nr:MAG TPA: hypothetical protein [Caudoviricetes sp.]
MKVSNCFTFLLSLCLLCPELFCSWFLSFCLSFISYFLFPDIMYTHVYIITHARI